MPEILPDAAFRLHIAVLGKTRSGKSSTMRGFVERLLRQHKPVCIIDPKGDWYGLKSSADGKRPGFPVMILGGEHADLPLNPMAGAHVGELIATGNRPCIIDLGGWQVGDRTRFFVDFASALFRHARGPRWLVIDEAHNFAPQGKVFDVDAGKMLHWANRLASEGGGKGLTLLSASQRPQKIHKDYLTCHETLIAMRVIHPLDRGAIKDWIDGCPDAEKGKEVLASLASMKRGEGWVWSPEIGFGPVLVHFPMFTTYDSFKAPTGEATERLEGWAEVDLAEVSAHLATLVEEAKANDPKLLKAEVEKLRRQMADAAAYAAKLGQAPDPDALRVARQGGYEAGYDVGLGAGHKDGYRAGMVAGYAECQRDARNDVALIQEHCQSIVQSALNVMAAKEWAGAEGELPEYRREATMRFPDRPVEAFVPPPAPVAAPISSDLKPVLQRALDALAWWRHIGQHPVERSRAAVLAGYSPRASTFHGYIAELAKMGLVDTTTPGKVGLTDAGLRLANLPTATTREELREAATNLLGTQQRRVFEAVYRAHPKEIRRDKLAEQLGLSARASTVHGYIADVAAYGVIEAKGRGVVRAADWLFP